MQIHGIVNVTRDSFSDGGRYLAVDAAVAHGTALLEAGADVLDVGGESTHPDAERVPAEVEIARVVPVLRHFAERGVVVAVDTVKPEVMSAAIEAGAGFVNDVGGLRDPACRAVVARHPEVRVVVMYARNDGGRAARREGSWEGIEDEVAGALDRRLDRLSAEGISRARVLVDPGMGFFLGANPEPSLRMLARIRTLRRLGCPVYVSVSRKSFLGSVLGGRGPEDRAHATLAAELWAAAQGVDVIRTHAPRALRDAWTVWQVLAGHALTT